MVPVIPKTACKCRETVEVSIWEIILKCRIVDIFAGCWIPSLFNPATFPVLSLILPCYFFLNRKNLETIGQFRRYCLFDNMALPVFLPVRDYLPGRLEMFGLSFS